jgi:hypothetical protein
MFQVFQIFQRYVASVLHGCCKSRSGCYIRCKCFIGMLQRLFQSVSSVSEVCCICFTHMLQEYVPNVSTVFHSYYVAVSIFML